MDLPIKILQKQKKKRTLDLPFSRISSGFTSSLHLGRVGEDGCYLVLVSFHEGETQPLDIVIHAWRRKENVF